MQLFFRPKNIDPGDGVWKSWRFLSRVTNEVARSETEGKRF